MESIRNGTNELIYKTEIVTNIDHKPTVTKRDGRGEINWEIGIDICTLLLIKYITNKDLL